METATGRLHATHVMLDLFIIKIQIDLGVIGVILLMEYQVTVLNVIVQN